MIAGLQLVNQSNYCYQHAFILSYMWASHFAAGCSLPPLEASSGFHGRLKPVIDFLTSGVRRVILSRCLMWASLLQQWRQPQRQHDVGEFMSHVMQKARPASMWGAWHMMTAAGEVRDVGDFHGPLMVHFCSPRREQSTTLQALVDGWTDAGEGMRRLITRLHHCCAYRFLVFMVGGRYASSCTRLNWGMAGSTYHVGSDQALMFQNCAIV